MNSLLSFIRRKILRIPADRWDYQYQRGEWNNLGQETARFDAVVALITSAYNRPSILEIGCGPALMLQRINEKSFSSFTGVDLSTVAIASAKKFEREGIHFIAADMQTFTPESTYDVVAFNESLYYAKDPEKTFARYVQYLKPGGSIIVTAFEHKHTSHLWPAIEARWQPVHKQVITVGEHRWSIRLYKPTTG